MDTILLADIGSTFTKVCSVRASNGELIASACAPTTIGDDVNRGLDAALEEAGCRPEGSAILACSSAAGGLRIVAIGLIPALTLEAARRAALGAGGKVIRAFTGRLTRGDLDALEALAPDLVLLAGGTDGGDREHILFNAEALAGRTSFSSPLIFAGNREARDDAMDLLARRPDTHAVENVMPELGRLNIEPARECIRHVFLERIVIAKGLDRLRGRARVLMPTPEAVLRALQLLHRGRRGIAPGRGELLAVDIGGATTDVYSCAGGEPRQPAAVLHGLPEPFVKRTVEGDIGVRHTLASLAEEADLDAGAAAAGVSRADLEEWVATAGKRPDRIAQTSSEEAIDRWLAREGVRLAVARHAGRLEERYTPQGRVFVQEGKDLTGVPLVIGSGGPIARSAQPQSILAGAVRAAGEPALKPEAPALWVDRHYLLWAVGLLAGDHDELALRLADQTLAACPHSTGENHDRPT